jgi:hypothetical protein
MLHYYSSILLIAFVLASCFYRRHVQDWRLFRTGVYLQVAGMIAGHLSGLLGSSNIFGGNSVLSLLASAAELAAFTVLVLSCTRGAELDQPLRCPKCHYTLKGLSEPRCPECGFQI